MVAQHFHTFSLTFRIAKITDNNWLSIRLCFISFFLLHLPFHNRGGLTSSAAARALWVLNWCFMVVHMIRVLHTSLLPSRSMSAMAVFPRSVSCGIFRFPFFFLSSHIIFCSSKHSLSAGLMRFVCVIREQTCTNTKSEKVNPNVSAHRNNHIIHIVFTHYDCVTFAVFPILPLEFISRRRRRFRRPHTFCFLSFCAFSTYSCVNVNSRQSHAMCHTILYCHINIVVYIFFSVTSLSRVSSQFANVPETECSHLC